MDNRDLIIVALICVILARILVHVRLDQMRDEHETEDVQFARYNLGLDLDMFGLPANEWDAPLRARPYVKPIYTDERATKNPQRPYNWEVECPDL